MNLQLGSPQIQVDLSNPVDISIPLESGGNNPNCFDSKPPLFAPVVENGFIGSIVEGGSCNHQRIEITPHGNGTHTECYGHISGDPHATINNCLKRFHFLAQLVTVSPYLTEDGDRIVRWSDLKNRIGQPTANSLIIRTLPNDYAKLTTDYSGTNPPYLERKISQKLAEMNFSHLLVDLPSIDKENDEGKLYGHRAFWQYPERTRTDSTITELIYVPDAVVDGIYLLNLQIISLESDASPSKPVLYPLLADSSK